MKVIIQPYSPRSEGARELVKALRNIGISTELKNPGFVPGRDDVVVNWGCGFHTIDNPHNVKIFNPDHLLQLAINKLKFFKHLDKYPGVSKVPFFTSQQTAEEFMRRDGNKHAIYCRTQLAKRSGKGIVVAHKPSELVPCSLYTVQCPNTNEYRIQVFHDRIISELEKRPRGEGKINYEIRTDDNGWFYKKDVIVPPVVLDVASRTIKALGLDFGGVDIIYDKASHKAWALEVNTAPGLKERSASLYAQAIAHAL